MTRIILALAASTLLVSAPAFATEMLTASFTTPDGGVTTDTYGGTVRLTDWGFGTAMGERTNDAFYIISPPSLGLDPYYQLTFGRSTLLAFTPCQSAVNYITGGRPAYDPTHIYSFLFNTGAPTPTQLHFGVGDRVFADNAGAFTIMVSQVPELATWAMMIIGFGLIGGTLRRRR